tara:strand:- start:548 stop:787 length:240 start_codon:yes stop_codon:yes gene_type:complete
MIQDAWKRPISSIKNKHYQQIQFNFKPCKSTIEEQEIWNEQELKPWAEKQLGIVALMSFIQLFMIGLMFSVFWLNNRIF